MTMSEWSATWQAVGIIVTLIVGIATVIKVWKDLNSTREQKKAADKLEKTKFLLEQHRRLFDSQDLKDVLQHIDGDDIELSQFYFWEKNRKFIVFIEEIQILINSGYLDETSCQYMFGYYAFCTYPGEIFKRDKFFKINFWDFFQSFPKTSNYIKQNSLKILFSKISI
ncbi:hypothetical protein [Delftia sp.]|uniref:hypothetical protein n=1 Tax=Delftia sp. TaxID=1886637 RepID=UPI00259CD46B|nr:hypothetical protein [Delftia sp.]